MHLFIILGYTREGLRVSLRSLNQTRKLKSIFINFVYIVGTTQPKY